MCNITEKYKEEEVMGYKVVAKHKKTGKYYSLAFGFEYKQPVHTFGKRKIQNRISYNFNNYILDKYGSGGFREKMIGRTAVFVRRCDARIQKSCWDFSAINESYKRCIVKVKLTNGLMEGTYGSTFVVAGRTMEILKEIR